MVQEFQVFRCSSCQVFQVHQVKKSKKWSCKLCGEKQSLLKVYGRGSGSDCRLHVQKLNLLRGQVEEAATRGAGESCQNDVFDDDDDETKPQVSQEAAPMSRWNKYLEESNDAPREEEDGLISTDQEDYYSHQDCTPRTVRKRKNLLYQEGDFSKEAIKENMSKRNKIYEGGSSSESGQFSCRIPEDSGCLKQHDKRISHTLPLHASSDTFLSGNTVVGRFQQSACSTAGFLKRGTKMDTIFNNCDDGKKIGPDCCVTSSQDVLPRVEPTTANCPSPQKISTPGLHPSGPGSRDQQADIIKTRSLVPLPKPVIQYHIFHTDDDFDDNY